MLPTDLLSLIHRDDATAVPRYLTPRDEVWVRLVLDALDAFVGKTVAERDAALGPTVSDIARAHGARARAALGVTHVVGRRMKAGVVSAIDPTEARRVTFEESAQQAVFERQAVLRRAAERLDTTEPQLEQSLFADRPGAHVIAAAPSPVTPLEAIELYNLALVQGILLRSERVVVEVREHVRAVVRFAKLAGLLCTCAGGREGTRLDVSGPLSILRRTTKYGHALAKFFPAVVSTARFRLSALCLLQGTPTHVRISAVDRIARTHKLPRDADSTVERALARDVRRLDTGWVLEREANAITVGGRMFFPDFTLRRGDDAVLVEIVGYWTPEYLRTKLEVLRAAKVERMIVCVDESLDCGDGEIPGPVMRFKRKVDAAALLSEAEKLVDV